jgi:hypothetical protein
VIVAVPFHGLATSLFLKIDKVLAGTRTLYETLNITKLVIRLGSSGRISLSARREEDTEIRVTRSHLVYSDPLERRRNIEQIRMTGTNLGASDIYADLVRPVLEPKSAALVVTPVLLGFALTRHGVKKASATTDRHGNFRVSIGPRLRNLTRLFKLLDEIERLQNVVSTTSNIPILQSTAIEEIE